MKGLKWTAAFSPFYRILKALYTPRSGTGMRIDTPVGTFNHPLGLAGGFDKNAVGLKGLSALGFSFIESGTVTPRPQPGNARPRLFRLMADQALINRMGFPGQGVNYVAENLRRFRQYSDFPVALSPGKNKETPLQDAALDYAAVIEKAHPYVDFFVVNVSSPNTPELRQLQSQGYLDDLLGHLQNTLRNLDNERQIPLLVKIAPDLSMEELDQIIDVVLAHQIAGIVATNTTLSREGLKSPHQNESGGLSGKPLAALSTDIIRYIYRHAGPELMIIGTGGVFSGDDVWEKMCAGATLVQSYTGFVYRGPAFVRQVINDLQQRMEREGVKQLQDITGIENRSL